MHINNTTPSTSSKKTFQTKQRPATLSICATPPPKLHTLHPTLRRKHNLPSPNDLKRAITSTPNFSVNFPPPLSRR